MPIKNKGYSLLELVFTLSIFTIVYVFSSNLYQSLFTENELETIKAEIKGIINLAQSHSMSTSSTLYLSGLTRADDWSGGVKLYKNNPKKIIYQKKWIHRQWTIRWKGFSSSVIPFHHNSFALMANGQVSISNKHLNKKKILTLNRIGRVIES